MSENNELKDISGRGRLRRLLYPVFRHLFIFAAPALLTLSIGTCTLDEEEENEFGVYYFPLEAFCSVNVRGIGWVDAETDYLPHVIQCENGGADLEALKAQAVAARSYMYYKMETSGSVADGTGDQVYSCGHTPQPIHLEAVSATAGQVLTYMGVTVCAFYVAGADPSNRGTCIATSGDSDPTGTEHYVTYNEGLSGDDVEQTTLGLVHPTNHRNRGCMSQWGARCLDEGGDGYRDILRFYYGADIIFETAEGECVTPTCDPDDTVCDGIDNDCDGSVDEDYVPHLCGEGACMRESTCVDGVESCTPGEPAADDSECNGIDDDCDGLVDEDCDDSPPDSPPDGGEDGGDIIPGDLPDIPVEQPDIPGIDIDPDGYDGVYAFGITGGCGCSMAL